MERPDLDAMEREMADVRKRVAELERLMGPTFSGPFPPTPTEKPLYATPIYKPDGEPASVDDLPTLADFYPVDDGA